MRPGGSIADVPTALPSRHGAAVDPELARQRGVAGSTVLDIAAGARRGRGIGVQFEIHQPVFPPFGRRQRRDCVAATLAPVGPQGPPARRAARLAGVGSRARGSLPGLRRGRLYGLTGTSCASSRVRRRCCSISIACRNRPPSRQSSETKHLRGAGLYGTLVVKPDDAYCVFSRCWVSVLAKAQCRTIRGELASGRERSRYTLVFGRSAWTSTMMQSCASAAKLPDGRPIL
jgi:hypothetical protein